MISGKKIAIVGFGKEGLSSANYLGGQNQISIIDQKEKRKIDKNFFNLLKVPARFYLGGHLPNETFDLIVRSPGARPDDPTIKKLAKSVAKITSATKIFFDECPGKIIGITGTKGKGTTSTLIYEMLKTQYKNTHLAGNIGIPMLDFLPKLNKQSLVVLELSSFQLIDLHKSPHIAVVLMITQEHLDWHKDRREYQRAKQSIVAYQKRNDLAVINQDFNTSKSFANKTKAKVIFVSTKKKTKGIYLKNSKIISQINGAEKIISKKDILIPGLHNMQNAMAATAVAKILNVKTSNIAKVLKTFKGLIHRLQLVKEINGVKFYNDSFATTPETTIAAIEAFASPKILILGGSSKNSNFTKLGQKIATDKTIKALILIGVEAARIKEAIDKYGGFKGTIRTGLKNMESIIREVNEVAAKGDIVLLSPACASFDMFKNYQDRGEQFIKYVNKLK